MNIADAVKKIIKNNIINTNKNLKKKKRYFNQDINFFNYQKSDNHYQNCKNCVFNYKGYCSNIYEYILPDYICDEFNNS